MFTLPIAALLTLIVVALVLWLINGFIPIPVAIKKIINVVLALIVVGVALWFINVYVPMAGAIKAILNIVVVVATCVGVLQALGLWEPVVRMWNRMRASMQNHVKEQKPAEAEVPAKRRIIDPNGDPHIDSRGARETPRETPVS